mmetsp:Transcript_248/g.486  ORF Transcript_248/g.486 Transcript_248/m.486 type:complete len:80 (+) Transcript_248:155-394(+)
MMDTLLPDSDAYVVHEIGIDHLVGINHIFSNSSSDIETVALSRDHSVMRGKDLVARPFLYFPKRLQSTRVPACKHGPIL